jgi:carotenoid cleavage dioxygenase-like enzyme
VPKPGAVDEDDGAVLSVVLDAAAGNSYLAVLDARSFSELARVDAPHHIPFGFHGIFR